MKFLLLFLFFIPLFVFGQLSLVWTVNIGDGRGSSLFSYYLTEDHNGNIYAGGTTFQVINRAFLNRYNSTGLFDNSYVASPNPDISGSTIGGCLITNDSNLLTLYNSQGISQLTKLSLASDTIWKYTTNLGMTFNSRVHTFDDDENMYWANAGDTSIIINRLNHNGQLAWRLDLPYESINSLHFANDTLRLLSMTKLYYIHPEGYVLEANNYEYPEHTPFASAIEGMADGGWLMGELFRAYRLNKVSSNGTLEWTYFKPSEGPQEESIERTEYFLQDEYGNTYVTGPYVTEADNGGVLTTKLGSDGELIWERRFDAIPGSTYFESPRKIKYQYGKIIVCGLSIANDASNAIVVIYDTMGNEVGHIVFDSGIENWDEAFTTMLTADGGLIVLGKAGDEQMFLHKYDLPVGATYIRPLHKAWRLGPNPSSGVIQLSALEHLPPVEEVSMSLFDASGRLCLEKALSQFSSEIDLTNLPAGTYWLRLQAEQEYWIEQLQLVK